jgi:PBSX family phage terminase large subunit
MTLSPKQEQVLLSAQFGKTRLNILDGAVRSGKTYISIPAWVQFVTSFPDPTIPFLMTGRTERTLYRNVIGPMIGMYGTSHIKYKGSLGELRIGDRLCYLAGASNEKSEHKIRGLTVGGVYSDELTLHSQSFTSMALSRMSVPGARFFATTNPDSPAHYVKKNFLDRAADLDLRHWRFRLEDNLHLPKEYIRALKAEFSGLFYRRLILGEWCMAEGAIYDCFDPSLHVVDSLPDKRIRAWVGIDYGTMNATAFVYILEALDSTNRPALYIADEYYHDGRGSGKQKTDAQYSSDLKLWLKQLPLEPDRIYIDPSAASFITQCHRDGIARVSHANNDVLDGIRSVSMLYADQRLFYVKHKAPITQEQTQGYTWDDKATLRGEDKPIKVNDHTQDAKRYGIMGARNTWRHWFTATTLPRKK